MMLLERCLQMTAKILVKWVVFADVTLVICMHWPCRVQHACDICWCQQACKGMMHSHDSLAGCCKQEDLV
jgi:hypothetical protein